MSLKNMKSIIYKITYNKLFLHNFSMVKENKYKLRKTKHNRNVLFI